MRTSLLKYLPPKIKPAGLVAYWPLGNIVTAGKVFNYVGNTIVSLSGTNIAPVYPGFSFNGSDDYIDPNNAYAATFASDFTVILCYKAGATQTAKCLFGVNKLITEANRFKITQSAASATMTIAYETSSDFLQYTTSSFNVGVGVWAVAAYSVANVGGTQARLRLYINNTLIHDETGTAAMASYAGGGNPYIGAECGAAGAKNFFNGSIGDVMIFNKVLSAEETRSVYEQIRWRYKI